jgi:hypothetical protein
MELFSSIQDGEDGVFKRPVVVSNAGLAPPLNEREFPPFPGTGDREGLSIRGPEMMEVTPDFMVQSSEDEDLFDRSAGTDTSTATTATAASRKRRANNSSSENKKVRKSRKTFLGEEREDAYLRQETEVISKWRKDKDSPAAKALMGKEPSSGEAWARPSELTTKEMEEQVNRGMSRIREIAGYKKGLKGTSQKVLREVAQMVERAVKEMGARPKSEEVFRLQAANSKLRKEVDALREELAGVKSLLESIRDKGPAERSSSPRLRKPTPAVEPLSLETKPRATQSRARKLSSSSSSSEDEAKKKAPPRRSPPPGPVAPPALPLSGAAPHAGPSGTGKEKRELRKPPPQERGTDDLEEAEERFLRKIMDRVGNLVNARLDAIQGRLLPEEVLLPRPETKRAGTETGTGAPARGRGPRTSPGVAVAAAGPGLAAAGSVRTASVSAPAPPTTKVTAWTEVVGRKSRKREEKGNSSAPASSASTATQKKPGIPGGASAGKGGQAKGKCAEKQKKRKIKVPKQAAVVLTAVDNSKVSVSAALSKVRNNIDLRSLGIASLRPKRALTGAIIYEVPGEESQSKADALAEKLRRELSSDEVKVTRPVKTAELRISGLDDVTNSQGVAEAMSRVGGCATWEIQVGEIRRPRMGLGSVWVRCPAGAARKLTEAGRFQVGWVMARVEALRQRPAQCFKCWGTGHTIATCDSRADRRGLCYRCGQGGHTANKCEDNTHCSLCADLGRPAGHRFGGSACSPPPPARGEAGRNRRGGEKPKRAGPETEAASAVLGAPNASEAPAQVELSMEVEARPKPGPQSQIEAEASSLEEAMDMEL